MLMTIIQFLIPQNTVSVDIIIFHLRCIIIFLTLAASVDENNIPARPLLTVTATDRDSRTAMGFGNVTYSIDEANSSFTINNMGEISVKRNFVSVPY